MLPGGTADCRRMYSSASWVLLLLYPFVIFEMVQKRPQALGQMLAIISETRRLWYPETEAYSIAAECFWAATFETRDGLTKYTQCGTAWSGSLGLSFRREYWFVFSAPV